MLFKPGDRVRIHNNPNYRFERFENDTIAEVVTSKYAMLEYFGKCTVYAVKTSNPDETWWYHPSELEIYTPKNNYEKIKEMSFDEMNKFLNEHSFDISNNTRKFLAEKR